MVKLTVAFFLELIVLALNFFHFSKKKYTLPLVLNLGFMLLSNLIMLTVKVKLGDITYLFQFIIIILFNFFQLFSLLS